MNEPLTRTASQDGAHDKRGPQDQHGCVVGQALPPGEHHADTVQLFLYNAAIWNPHRIHYDLPYTTQTEGHPSLLIDGPLQGDWMMQRVYAFMRTEDQLRGFDYSNRRAAYVGETLTVQGEVASLADVAQGVEIVLALRVLNPQGQQVSVGSARVFRPQA